MNNNMNSIMPYFGLNVCVMILFCTASTSVSASSFGSLDCVRAKPWLGVLGVISAISGTVTAFGLCATLGIPFIGINLAILFLMLGKTIVIHNS